MYYYQHHIGDYRKDTTHLSILEHGAYRQLLDLYYISEQPLPLDDAKLMRLVCARNADEVQAVKNVLEDFFQKTKDGYIQSRCDKEIDSYHGKSLKAKASAEARWNKNKDLHNANALRAQSEGNANHKPITNNQNTVVGEICIAIKKEGIIDINPANPTLLTLINSGASIEEFSNAAKIAKEKGKNFAYTLAIVKGQREDAKNINVFKGDLPKKESTGWRNDDQLVLKKAASLNIYTSGKSRYEILAAIDRKEGKV